MGACTQNEIDSVVARCHKAAKAYGGQSDKLAEVRKYYQMFHVCPEHMAMVILEAALDKVEECIVDDMINAVNNEKNRLKKNNEHGGVAQSG